MSYATESNSPQATAPLDAEAFQARTGVSAATLERLRLYLAQLARWQARINLVGRATLADPWRRHFLDSAQLLKLLPADAATLVDIGSGAGFPGLVLAIMAMGRGAAAASPGISATLIESDQRKAIFLNEIIRLTGVPAIVHEVRAEAYAGCPGDVVTARACAPLARLLPLAAAVGKAGATHLLLKGAAVGDELTAAGKDWTMRVDRHPSETDPGGVILEITDLARRDPKRDVEPDVN